MNIATEKERLRRECEQECGIWESVSGFHDPIPDHKDAWQCPHGVWAVFDRHGAMSGTWRKATWWERHKIRRKIKNHPPHPVQSEERVSYGASPQDPPGLMIVKVGDIWDSPEGERHRWDGFQWVHVPKPYLTTPPNPGDPHGHG